MSTVREIKVINMKDCRSCSYKNILEAKDVERETAAPEAIDHS